MAEIDRRFKEAMKKYKIEVYSMKKEGFSDGNLYTILFKDTVFTVKKILVSGKKSDIFYDAYLCDRKQPINKRILTLLSKIPKHLKQQIVTELVNNEEQLEREEGIKNNSRNACYILLQNVECEKYSLRCECLEPNEGTENYRYNNQEPCYIELEANTMRKLKFCPICGNEAAIIIPLGRAMSIGGVPTI